MLSYYRGLPNRDWDVHRYRMNIHTIPIATQLPMPWGTPTPPGWPGRT